MRLFIFCWPKNTYFEVPVDRIYAGCMIFKQRLHIIGISLHTNCYSICYHLNIIIYKMEFVSFDIFNNIVVYVVKYIYKQFH